MWKQFEGAEIYSKYFAAQHRRERATRERGTRRWQKDGDLEVCRNQRAEHAPRHHALTSLGRLFPSAVSFFGCHLTLLPPSRTKKQKEPSLEKNLLWSINSSERHWEFLELSKLFLNLLSPTTKACYSQPRCCQLDETTSHFDMFHRTFLVSFVKGIMQQKEDLDWICCAPPVALLRESETHSYARSSVTTWVVRLSNTLLSLKVITYHQVSIYPFPSHNF